MLKKKEKDIILIRIQMTVYNDREIANMKGLHKSTINRIRTGKTWKHIPANAEKIVTRKSIIQ